jgi:hypothetical protein
MVLPKDSPMTLTGPERGLLLRVARCDQIADARLDGSHPCHAVVNVQRPHDERNRQVPEAWAGNLAGSRVVFVSSNPSISGESTTEPDPTDEDYPVAGGTDNEIVEFLGRRFARGVVLPAVRDFRYRQRNGDYATRPTRFWVSIHQRAVELLGESADPAVNYVMTEVVHCKSKSEIGVGQAAKTCSERYLDGVMRLTMAPILVVVGRQAHLRLKEKLATLPDATDPPYIFREVVGGLEREIIYLRHPSSYKGTKTIEGTHGPGELLRMRGLLKTAE